ncbi:hypothetical protein A2U01_0100661, partial [Trifolium medium]|nr:hypothetical protein [Trifolium medium]
MVIGAERGDVRRVRGLVCRAKHGDFVVILIHPGRKGEKPRLNLMKTA